MPLPLGTVLKAAIVAGLIAGLATALFHLAVTEPVIDQAIVFEEQVHGAEAAHEAPLVSRDVQRAGLVVGYLLYGLMWALPFGAIYHAAQRLLPTHHASRRGLLLALAAYWATGLFPFLKYPANPPGVGEPETIAYRQTLYLSFLALSVAGTTLAVALGRTIGRSGQMRSLSALTFSIVSAVVLYLAMPVNLDPVPLPTDLVLRFRVLSLVGITLFWGVLGLGFGWLVRTEQGRSTIVLREAH